jgi:hypothetical protein
MSLGQHEYGNRLRPHAGSMGNAEDAPRPGVRVFHPESIRSRGTHRPPSRGDERQFAGYYADRTQGPDKRLIQIVGRSGLTSGIRGINNCPLQRGVALTTAIAVPAPATPGHSPRHQQDSRSSRRESDPALAGFWGRHACQDSIARTARWRARIENKSRPRS